MNKFTLLIGIVITSVFSACQLSQKDYAVMYESGVSYTLAEFRKTNYQDVRYDLMFTLPINRNETVSGRIDIYTNLLEKVPVIIDFRADSSQVKAVKLGKKDIPYTFENEHIRIDAEYVEKGSRMITIDFISDNQSLNRRDDYMYTLLVPDRARTLFPCFDQPNLKARYKLSLDVPEGWKVIGNSPLEKEKDGHLFSFLESEPLSSYLFSFVAGKFEEEIYDRDGRQISIYHRETDPLKVAQCPEIASEVFDALEWMEEYTAIPYPFAKYDLIILPGFQFGGMEHTGATLYNDRRMFLNAQPTLNERLSRSSLIAHETAHMWFGDYVTMEWFDDVWTKEVFANYFAARMVEPLYPEINHRLNFIRAYYPSAYSEDRTAGTTPIKQPLDNLSNAGLVYGQIIYNKSPIIMEMLVEKIGEEAFRRGIQEYLSIYAYNNATWEGLINILDSYTSEDLKSWSQVWVNEKGMPEINLFTENGILKGKQNDLTGKGLYWPQNFNVRLIDQENSKDVEICFKNKDTSVDIKVAEDVIVIPNTDGRGYGFFKLSVKDAESCFKLLSTSDDDVLKGSLLLVLYENLLNKTIEPEWYCNELLRYIPKEKNSLLYSMAIGHLANCLYYFNLPTQKAEQGLWDIVLTNVDLSHCLQAFRTYHSIGKSPEAINRLYTIWKDKKNPGGCELSENDYISLSYSLAIRKPEKADEIIITQQSRITNPDRLKEYNFIAPSVSPVKSVRDSVFTSLFEAENRRVEPWASTILSHLNSSYRQNEAIGYIRPALDILPEIQRTGDIFFPTSWLRALLAGHLTPEARMEIDRFFDDNPDYHPMLKNKIKQQCDHLYRF